MGKLYLKLYFYLSSKVQYMLKARDHKTLVDQRNRFTANFKKVVTDIDYRAILGDLTGYFTENNFIIEEPTGNITFTVGDYCFIMQPTIFLKTYDDATKTNLILFRTFEDIKDLSRTGKSKESVKHIPALDMQVYFANKENMQYSGATERITFSINGFDNQTSLDNNIIGEYCRVLIAYIENVEKDY